VQRKAREAISIAAGRLLPLTTRLCGSLIKNNQSCENILYEWKKFNHIH